MPHRAQILAALALTLALAVSLSLELPVPNGGRAAKRSIAERMPSLAPAREDELMCDRTAADDASSNGNTASPPAACSDTLWQQPPASYR
ncbi:MAG: hypothetical protein ACK5JT_05280 [Hyphomicrobiaceae bacterium]